MSRARSYCPGARRGRGLALVPVLVLAAVASVVALGAATRAQIDTRLAAYAAATARADFVAAGLLEALLDDLAVRLQDGARISAAGPVCAAIAACAADSPRVAAVLRRTGEDMLVQLALVEATAGDFVYLPEERASGQRSHQAHLLEARVSVSGAGQAMLAATVAVVEPRPQEPGE